MYRIIGPVNVENAEEYHAQDLEYSGFGGYFAPALNRKTIGKLAEALSIPDNLTRDLFGKLTQRKIESLIPKGSSVIPPEKNRPFKTAYWISIFPSPKSVSVVALIGGDKRLIEGHELAVRKAFELAEQFPKAKNRDRRGGGPVTGNLIAAAITHDDDRPVNGVVCPHLHSHINIFNLTKDQENKVRALETIPLFRSQQLIGLEYQFQLAGSVLLNGYGIEKEEGQTSWEWRIVGTTDEYLSRYSLRTDQMKEISETEGLIQSISRFRERASKSEQDAQVTGEYIEKTEKEFEGKARTLFEQSISGLAVNANLERIREKAIAGVAYAVSHLSEADTVLTEKDILGETDFWLNNFDRSKSGDFFKGNQGSENSENSTNETVSNRHFRTLFGIATAFAIEKMRVEGTIFEIAPGESDGRRFTTGKQIRAEHETVQNMLSAKDAISPIARPEEIAAMIREGEVAVSRELNESQKEAVTEILESRDRILGVQGYAGVGKTTVVSVLKEAIVSNGFHIHGLAPTGRAAKLLSEVGIRHETLQMFLKRGKRTEQPTVFVLDESSLAGGDDIGKLFQILSDHDRLLMLGDIRQHQSIGPGCMFETLQRAGMKTAFIDEIVRQSNIELWGVVQAATGGDIEQSMARLKRIRYTQGVDNIVGGFIREVRAGNAGHALVTIPEKQERLEQLAKDYSDSPDDTLVVVPDNRTRVQLNNLIRQELKSRSLLAESEVVERVLVPAKNVSDARMKFAAAFQPGQILRLEGNFGEIPSKTYFRIQSIKAEENRMVLRNKAMEIEVDAANLPNLSLYNFEERGFSVGDKIQFTAGDPARNIVNRQQGKIVSITPEHFSVESETGETIEILRTRPLHLEYAYGVTSYISQGQTARRVLANLESFQPEQILNERLAYVVFSRAVSELRVYTDDDEQLVKAIGRKHDKESALEAYLGFEAGIRKAADEWSNDSPTRREIVDNWLSEVSAKFGNEELHTVNVSQSGASAVAPEAWRAGNRLVAEQRLLEVSDRIERENGIRRVLTESRKSLEAQGPVPEEMRNANDAAWLARSEALRDERDRLAERLSALKPTAADAVPFIERNLLLDLSSRAFKRKDADSFQKLVDLRHRMSAEFDQPLLVSEETERLRDLRGVLVVERWLHEENVQKFETTRQHWKRQWGPAAEDRNSLVEIARMEKRGEIGTDEAENRRKLISNSLLEERQVLEAQSATLETFEKAFGRLGISEGKAMSESYTAMEGHLLKLRKPTLVRNYDAFAIKRQETEIGRNRSATRHFLARIALREAESRLAGFEVAARFRMVGYRQLDGSEEVGRIADVERKSFRRRLADVRDQPGPGTLQGWLGRSLVTIDRTVTEIPNHGLRTVLAWGLDRVVEGREPAHARREIHRSFELTRSQIKREVAELKEFTKETEESVIRWGGKVEDVPDQLILHHREAEKLWRVARTTGDKSLQSLVLSSYENGQVGAHRIDSPEINEKRSIPGWFQPDTRTVNAEEIWTQTAVEVNLERRRAWTVEVEKQMADQEKKLKEMFLGPDARPVMHIWDPVGQKYIDYTVEADDDRKWNEMLANYDDWLRDQSKSHRIDPDRGFDRGR